MVSPIAWSMPPTASSARIVVGMIGVPEPRADVLSVCTAATPDPDRSNRTIVSADFADTLARHMSYS